MIRGFNDLNPGLVAQNAADTVGEFRVRVDPGADCRATEGHFAKLPDRLRCARSTSLNLPRIAEKFLPEADWRRVLQMRAPGLDHRHQLAGLGS